MLKLINVANHYVDKQLSRVNPESEVNGRDYNRVVDLYNALVHDLELARSYQGHGVADAENMFRYEREFKKLYNNRSSDLFKK